MSFKRQIANGTNTIQGWLTVSHEISDGADWQKRYCVLITEERRLYFFPDQDAAMSHPPIGSASVGSKMDHLIPDFVDGGMMSSLKRSGNNYGTLNSSESHTSFQRGTRTSRSFRDKVRSLHKTRKMPRSETHSVATGDLILPRMKGGRSLENIHRVGSADSDIQICLGDPGTYLDLAKKNSVNIQAVHPSVSPRHSCFRIIRDNDTLYASCGSQEELSKWILNLNQHHQPNKDHLRRVNTHLHVWMFEARNLQLKKKYFCEIHLNNILYAQTCCKAMNEILFWGEPFTFEELPSIGSVVLKLYKEIYKKRERSVELIGKIEIPTIILESGQVFEKWHLVSLSQPSKTPSNPKEVPAIRIKVQYQVVSILPLKSYDSLLKYLRTNFASLCEVLEPALNAKTKDEIAQTLLRILQQSGKAKEFLCDIIMAEVQHVDNENLIFRGNTFATKAVDTYMKMVGDTYLRETLTGFILQLLETEDDCEVDPSRLAPTASLYTNQQVLTRLIKRVWLDILASWTKFPSDLQNTLHGIRQRFGAEKEEVCFKLISGSIFLRFFCPAILSPSLFQLCQEYPDEKTARKLTLVAKVIQTMANFTRFGVKEEYMCFMNELVESEINNMQQFIDRISSPIPDSSPVIGWGPFQNDLGRELSIMHTTLLVQIPTLKENAIAQISELPDILGRITNTIHEDREDPLSSTYEALRIMQSTISKFTPQSLNQTLSSSEYTTPSQSTSTSPTAERRPLSQQIPAINHDHSRQGSTPADWIGNSTSPTDNKSSKTLGHRSTASLPQQQLHSIQQQRSSSSLDTDDYRVRSNSINIPSPLDFTSSLSESEYLPEIITEAPTPRRNSDSAMTRIGIKKMSVDMSFSESSQLSSKTNDSNNSFRFDQTIHMAELTAENSHLIEEVDRLKEELAKNIQQLRSTENDNKELTKSLLLAEMQQKKAEEMTKCLQDNRGKVLRGLNTQTEIAIAQFKRDFDDMKRQLDSKDEVIRSHERKIKALIEANCTLRNGLQQVHHHLPESESEDENGLGSVPNGIGEGASVQKDLAKFIKQLDL